MDSVPYNPLTDFTPIAVVADLPIVLVVHNSVPANTVAALIAQDKANPGKAFYASAGVGTTMHLSGELFNALAGTRLQDIAYRGDASAVNDVVAGTVQAGFIDFPSAGPHIASGRLKLLGVSNRKRALSAPDVLTIAEAGVPGYETSGWFGVVGPAKLPQRIVRRLHDALMEALATPELRARFLQACIEPTLTTPEQFAEFIRAEIPKWASVIERSGAEVEALIP
jgi:tripartite-type tricarboxylate transporter receptor subunit TctC